MRFIHVFPNVTNKEKSLIRSPLRYPGGKSRAARRITDLISPFDEFREPFVGGGSIFIRLKQTFPTRQFWINDKYAAVIDFWHVLQHRPNSMIEQIRSWKREFSDGKTFYRFLRLNAESFNKTERAAAFFALNRMTFSGTTNSGGFSADAFQSRFTASSIERLESLPELLRDVKITNCDYEKVVTTPGKNVFIYLDPPYFAARKSALYGKNGLLHKEFDHQRLAKIMKSCPHRWLMTYDDSPAIRHLYSFAQISEWKLIYGMRNQTAESSQIGNELLISNYEINNLIT